MASDKPGRIAQRRSGPSSRWVLAQVNKPVVLRVPPDPKPGDGCFLFHGERAVVQSNPHRPEAPNPLEMQRGMARVLLQQPVGLVRQPSNLFWKIVVATPEPWAGLVSHRSVQRPCRRSFKASSANASSRPADASSLIWRSQAAASNSANHARNAARSSGESWRTASSISSRVLIPRSLLLFRAALQP